MVKQKSILKKNSIIAFKIYLFQIILIYKTLIVFILENQLKRILH